MREIILVGAGYYGKQAFEYLKAECSIKGFADNDTGKHGQTIFGIPCFPLEEIRYRSNNETEVIISVAKHEAIAKQLLSLGVSDFTVFLEGHEYKYPKDNSYHRCCRCVMDNKSDSTILFDNNGVCNYCNSAYEKYDKIYFPNDKGQELLKQLIDEIKEEGKNKKYDCIMGLSGGLDSSYLAYLGYKWGLRVLAVHIDDGYDTEISKSNLKKLIDKTGFDYEIIHPDAAQFNDLTLAYMKAGVPNIAVPQDNILFAFLYKKMRENEIKYFLSGGNFALECILQQGNTYKAYDITNILDIHKRFGNKPIDKLELLSEEQKKYDESVLGMQSPRPLNYIDYNRDRAFKELEDFCGFQYYGRKHLENILTTFIQLYWFPKKFGVDKRSSHLSSMIVSGQMTRDEALRELEEPIYDSEQMEKYLNIILKNMGIDRAEFERIMAAQTHNHEEYDHE